MKRLWLKRWQKNCFQLGRINNDLVVEISLFCDQVDFLTENHEKSDITIKLCFIVKSLFPSFFVRIPTYEKKLRDVVHKYLNK